MPLLRVPRRTTSGTGPKTGRTFRLEMKRPRKVLVALSEALNPLVRRFLAMSILTALSVPCYSRDEVTGRGVATFDDRVIDFGPADDPRSAAVYDRTLAAWLANGRRLPSPEESAPAPAMGPIPWSQFRDEFMSLYEPPLRARSTQRGMGYALRRLEGLGIQSTADLTVALLARLVASCPEKNSVNSTVGLLRYVQAACSYAEKMGYVRISPFRVRNLSSFARRAPSRHKKHASRDEIRRVLEHMRERAQADGWKGWKEKRVFALTAILAYTGMRAGEALYLQVSDVDLTEGVLWIVSRSEHRLKTAASAAPIPMPPGLIPIVAEWLKHRMARPPGFKIDSEDCPWIFPTLRRHKRGPWVSGGPGCKPRDRMAAVAAEIGVVGFGPLMLRHSMATHLPHWGASSATVKRILRHTTERTAQQWYTHDDIPNLRAAVANVEF